VTATTTVNGDAPLLVIGGGITGLSAAVEASEAGHEVYLVERNPYLGGRVVQMNKYFPKLCPPTCGVEIHLKRLRTTPRVHLLTQTEVTAVSGGPGNFKVTLRTKARGVNANCTNCGECVDVCPASRPNDFNYGLNETKAIYLPFGQAFPARYAIDFEHCQGSSCGKCVEKCAFDAIHLDAKDETEELTCSAIVVATGWKPYDATKLEELAYGKAKNVVTNVEMERMAALDGPTGGEIKRPSDGEAPKRVAFVHCAGSRDELHLAHCSAVCCLASFKQARYVMDSLPEATVHHFYIDRRAPGRLEDFLQELEANERVTMTKGRVARIHEDPATGAVTLEAEDTLAGRKETFTADLAVLAVGMVPESGSAGFPAEWPTDAQGFLVGNGNGAPGVFAAGCAKRPAEVSASVKDATGAVLKAHQVLTQG
jgi:quinone-modifying oxidoreductase, subunit QmoA